MNQLPWVLPIYLVIGILLGFRKKIAAAVAPALTLSEKERTGLEKLIFWTGVISLAGFSIFLATLAIVFPQLRFISEFQANGRSFDSELIDYIEDTSAIAIPESSRGLRFQYLPPIDPIFFAEIEILPNSRQAVQSQLEMLEDVERFPEQFADDECEWWPPTRGDTIISKKAIPGDFYLEAILKQDGARLVLYLKYFTI